MSVVPFPQKGSVPYERMYKILFNAITDALDTIPNGRAREILKQAQLETEELYVEGSQENTPSKEV